ncbi:MAG: hypothetical protein AAFV53_15920 [Myxococcota bacterium]
MLSALLMSTLAMSPDALADGRRVELVDDGPTLMHDKREYRTLMTPGVMLATPGVKVRMQRLVTDNVSVMVGGGIGGGGISSCDCAGLSWARWQAVGGIDVHPIGNGFHGPYLGPRVLYRHGDARFGLFGADAETARDLLAVRGIVGYRWVFDPGLSVAIGVGGSHRQSLRTYTVDGEQTGATVANLVVPAAEFNLSWAF